MKYIDGDCDGVTVSVDCNDADPTRSISDGDCDGTVTTEDCNDGDPNRR